jgi:hypothetical protein
MGVMKLTLLEYYPDISASYPEYVTQRQMCEICGISKSTAYKAERRGDIPYEKETNRLVHTHKIKLSDVLSFKYRREYGYRRDDAHISLLRRFYVGKLKWSPDLLAVSDIAEITGFDSNSIQRWIGRGYLKAFVKMRRFRTPKVYLIDFLVGPMYNAIQDKSKKQTIALKEFLVWRSALIGGVKP